MASEDEQLEMTFDPSTIEHLGIRMYSTLPPVVAELIANAHDADAQNVRVKLFDKPEKKIVISDNGMGMSFDEINNSFLRIGRNRREEGLETTPRGRKVIGKKGLGKLAFFGISEQIEIKTVKNGKENAFEMNLQDILSSHDSAYHPRISVRNQPTEEPDGTKIVLHNVKRQTPFSAHALAISLSRYFFIDDDFEIEVIQQDGDSYFVSEELRLEGINGQFEWRIPEDLSDSISPFLKEHDIHGRVLASVKPLSPDMRGITLYSRGKLVNAPSSFVEGDSSHFYSYMTGCIDVSYLDLLPDDLVSTNRQSLNWDDPETIQLKKNLSKMVRFLERAWRDKRREEKSKKTQEKVGIDISTWIRSNSAETQESLTALVGQITDASETPDDEAAAMIQRVHDLIPEYAAYHWRNLHEEVQDASRQYYIDENYYTAVLESAKRYVAKVRRVSSSDLKKELDILQNVFQEQNPVLRVAMGYLKSDGTDFDEDTLNNIERGNRGFAVGMWQGFRNPISHEEIAELNQSGLFTEHDCLDALSLLSHLFRRLDNAQTV